jgi:hypothetical protein
MTKKKWFFSTYGSDLFTTHRNVTDVNRRVHVICKRPCVFDGGIANVQRDADVIKKIKKYAFLFLNKKLYINYLVSERIFVTKYSNHIFFRHDMYKQQQDVFD